MKVNAHLVDYGCHVSKAGKPLIKLVFKTDESDVYTKYCSLNEGKAREITLDTLISFGFVGTKLDALNDGKESGLLNTSQEVELVLEDEEYNGKVRKQIKYINFPGSAKFEKLEASVAKNLFAGMNIEGDLAARRAQHKVPTPPSGAAQGNDDLPF